MTSLKRAFALVALLSTPALAAPTTYKIDNGHTAALFAVKHLGISHTHGRFNTVAGQFTLDDADPTKSSVSVEIDANSIDSNEKKRDDHLRGPDFFNVKQFPKITFKSTAVKKTGDKQFDVTGDLTIHGVTKSVTLPVTLVGQGQDPWGGTRAGFDAALTIKRADYGVSFMPEGIGEDIHIRLAVEGVKQ